MSLTSSSTSPFRSLFHLFCSKFDEHVFFRFFSVVFALIIDVYGYELFSHC
ncbi:hypothetical protein Syun_007039 [Stephania yunnanensis]|uniref:Uncharacterized protein n=1 Tax=Stephania yunnanensis TaxID=152371 RepID=A0AAP0KZ76_9MAGN